jgi:hypothetical protein
MMALSYRPENLLFIISKEALKNGKDDMIGNVIIGNTLECQHIYPYDNIIGLKFNYDPIHNSDFCMEITYKDL